MSTLFQRRRPRRFEKQLAFLNKTDEQTLSFFGRWWPYGSIIGGLCTFAYHWTKDDIAAGLFWGIGVALYSTPLIMIWMCCLYRMCCLGVLAVLECVDRQERNKSRARISAYSPLRRVPPASSGPRICHPHQKGRHPVASDDQAFQKSYWIGSILVGVIIAFVMWRRDGSIGGALFYGVVGGWFVGGWTTLILEAVFDSLSNALRSIREPVNGKNLR